MDRNQYSGAMGYAIDHFDEQLQAETQAHEQTKLILAATKEALRQERERRDKYIEESIAQAQLIRDALDSQHTKTYAAVQFLRQAKRHIVYLECQLADARGVESEDSDSTLEGIPYDSDLDDDEFLQREIDEAKWSAFDEEAVGEDEVEEQGEECLSGYRIPGAYHGQLPSHLDSPNVECVYRNSNYMVRNAASFSNSDPQPYSSLTEDDWFGAPSPEVYRQARVYQEVGELHWRPAVPSTQHPELCPSAPDTPTGETSWVWNGRHWSVYDDNVVGLVREDNVSDFDLNEGSRF